MRCAARPQRRVLPALLAAATATAVFLLASAITHTEAVYSSSDITGPVIAAEIDGEVFGALGNYTFPITPSNQIVVLALRFRTIDVPNGAFLMGCRIIFYSGESPPASPTTVRITVATEAASGPITSDSFDISTRDLRAGFTTWEMPPWDSARRRQSPQLVKHLQSIVQSPGWDAGDPLMFILSSPTAPDGSPHDFTVTGGRRPYIKMDYVTLSSGSKTSKSTHALTSFITSNEGVVVIIALYAYAIATFVIVAYSFTRYGVSKKAKKLKVLHKQLSHNPIFSANSPKGMPSHPLHEWEIAPSALIIKREIGKGRFGRVYHATARELEYLGTVECAVKILSVGESTQDREKFFEQAFSMHTFGALEHTNVLQMYGVVTQSLPHMIITEYCAKGSLLETLKLSKEAEGRNRRNKRLGKALIPTLLLSDRVKLAADVACGMAFLANQGFVHRHVAATNCLVNDTFVAKVAGFDSAHVIKGKMRDKTNLSAFPVRWMSPQVLAHGNYSQKSDVWAFGVMLWECATEGDLPFTKIPDNETVMEKVLVGKVPEKPKSCPDSLFALMRQCWRMNPTTRPDFEDILSLLYDLHKAYRRTEAKFEFEKKVKKAEKRNSKSANGYDSHTTMDAQGHPENGRGEYRLRVDSDGDMRSRASSFRSRASTFISNVFSKATSFVQKRTARREYRDDDDDAESQELELIERQRRGIVARKGNMAAYAVADSEASRSPLARSVSQSNSRHGGRHAATHGSTRQPAYTFADETSDDGTQRSAVYSLADDRGDSEHGAGLIGDSGPEVLALSTASSTPPPRQQSLHPTQHAQQRQQQQHGAVSPCSSSVEYSLADDDGRKSQPSEATGANRLKTLTLSRRKLDSPAEYALADDNSQASGRISQLQQQQQQQQQQRHESINSEVSGRSDGSSSIAIIELYVRNGAGDFLPATQAQIDDTSTFLFQKFVVPENFQPRAVRQEYWDSVDKTYMYAPAQHRTQN